MLSKLNDMPKGVIEAFLGWVRYSHPCRLAKAHDDRLSLVLGLVSRSSTQYVPGSYRCFGMLYFALLLLSVCGIYAACDRDSPYEALCNFLVCLLQTDSPYGAII